MNIEIDNISTYPNELIVELDNFIEFLVRNNLDFTEYKNGMGIFEEINSGRYEENINQLTEYLLNTNLSINTYHISNLIEFELMNIKKFGLEKTTVDFIEVKLTNAHHNKIINKDDIKILRELSSKYQKSDRGDFCSMSSKSMVQYEMNQGMVFEKYWGGECISWAFNDEPHNFPDLEQKLQEIGKTYVLEVSTRIQDLDKNSSFMSTLCALLTLRLICNKQQIDFPGSAGGHLRTSSIPKVESIVALDVYNNL